MPKRRKVYKRNVGLAPGTMKKKPGHKSKGRKTRLSDKAWVKMDIRLVETGIPGVADEEWAKTPYNKRQKQVRAYMLENYRPRDTRKR